MCSLKVNQSQSVQGLVLTNHFIFVYIHVSVNCIAVTVGVTSLFLEAFEY